MRTAPISFPQTSLSHSKGPAANAAMKTTPHFGALYDGGHFNLAGSMGYIQATLAVRAVMGKQEFIKLPYPNNPMGDALMAFEKRFRPELYERKVRDSIHQSQQQGMDQLKKLWPSLGEMDRYRVAREIRRYADSIDLQPQYELLMGELPELEGIMGDMAGMTDNDWNARFPNTPRIHVTDVSIDGVFMRFPESAETKSPPPPRQLPEL